jgi:hypothetical protein
MEDAILDVERARKDGSSDGQKAHNKLSFSRVLWSQHTRSCPVCSAGTVVELRVSGGSAYLPDRSRLQWLTYMLTLAKGMFFDTQT